MRFFVCFIGCGFVFLPALRGQSGNTGNNNIDTLLSVKYFIVFPGAVYRRGVCKSNYWVKNLNMDSMAAEITTPFHASGTVSPKAKITGGITYEYLYRSYLDTPFVQNDFLQHSLYSNLVYTTASGTPIKLNFRIRISNSPFFRDNFDFNTVYTGHNLLQNIKRKLKDNITVPVNKSEIEMLEMKREALLAEIQQLGGIKNTGLVEKQSNVEMRERALRKQQETNRGVSPVDFKNQPDSLGLVNTPDFEIPENKIADIDLRRMPSRAELNKKKLAELKETEMKLNEARKNIIQFRNAAGRSIEAIKDAVTLSEVISKYNVPDSMLPRHYKFMLMFDKIGLGRNWVDFSELTVKNMPVSGILIEGASAPFIFSVAAGNINYGFRDFVIKNSTFPRQRLLALRGGVGKATGNKLVFTYYTGKKGLLNNYGSNIRALEQLSGISLEAQIKVAPFTFLSMEFAKSTLPDVFVSDNGKNKLLDFSMRANEAYAFKLSGSPGKSFKFSGFYKKAGERFQSFNMMPVSIRQEAWGVKVNQSMFKNRLMAEAGVRKNDFNNQVPRPEKS